MSSIDLATQFKIGIYICWTGKSIIYAFSSSTDIIQVLNKLPTDKRHYHKIGCYALHPSTRKKTGFEKCLFKCVARPELSGVPLTLSVYKSYLILVCEIILNDYTSPKIFRII